MNDLISRAEAIDALKRKQDDGKGDLSRFYNTIIQHDIEATMQLPPIQPKRGRWIGKYPVTSVCSECGFLIHDSKVKVFAYCPNCGAKMEVNHE